MSKSAVSALFAILLLSFLPACGGGGSDPVTVVTGLLGTAGCTASGIEDYAAVADAIVAELQKTPVPSTLNVNVVVDGKTVVLNGTISEPGGNLADGFLVGDAAEVIITSFSVDGVVTGSANLAFNFQSATALILAGNVQLTDGTCTVNLNGVNLTSDPTTDGYPSGAVVFETTRSDDTLVGQISVTGTSTGDVTASLNGGPELNFEIDLDTFEVNFFE